MFPTESSSPVATVHFVATTIDLLINQGKENEAKKILERSVEILKGSPFLLRSLLGKVKFNNFREKSKDHYLLSGVTNYMCGNNEKAYECYKKYFDNYVVENEFENMIMYSNFGEVCVQLGLLNEAVECFENSLRISLHRKDRIYEKSSYTFLGICYSGLAKYNEAITFSKKALSVSSEIGNMSGTGYDYQCLGNSYRCIDQYRQAIECFNKAIEIHKNEGDRLGEGSDFLYLGDVCLNVGEYQNAMGNLKKSLHLGIEQNDSTLLNRSYQALGDVHSRFRQKNKAIKFYKKSLDISLKLGSMSDVGGCYGRLGRLNYDTGNYDEAIDYFEKYLDICLQSGDRYHEGCCYLELGNICIVRADYDKGMSYYGKYSTICLKTDQQLNHYYSAVGNVYLAKGQYEKAEELFQKSLDIAKKIGNRSEQIDGYRLLASVAHKSGDFLKGVWYVKKSLSICEETGNRHGEQLNYSELAVLHCGLEQYEKAIEFINKSSDIAQEMGDRNGEASNLNNLAHVYFSLGNYEMAIHSALSGLEIFKSIGNQSGVANMYNNLCCHYLELNQSDKAIECCEKAIEIKEKIGEPLGLISANLGRAYGQAKRYEEAETFLRKGIKESDDFTAEFAADKNRTWLARECYRFHVSLSVSYFHLKRISAAFLALDLGKAKTLQILMEQHAELKTCRESRNSYRDETWQHIEESKEDQRLTDFANDLQLEENYSTVLMYNIEKFISDRPSVLIISVLNRDGKFHHCLCCPVIGEPTLEWFMETINHLMSSVRSIQLDRNCLFFGPLSSQVPGHQDDQLSDLLPTSFQQDDSKMPEISTFSKDTNITTIASASDASDVVDHPSDVLANNVTSIVVSRTEGNGRRKKYRQPPDNVDCIDSSYCYPLYDVLIKPVADLIEGNKLIIVPDKALFFTPFCMLKDKDGHYLSERYSIQVTPSLHSLILSMQVPQPDNLGPALFVGNSTGGKFVLYGKTCKFDVLPAAVEEARALALRFNAEPLLKEQATKDEVLQRIDKASIVHIAAHGHPYHGDILLAPNVRDEENECLPHERSYLLTQRDVIKRQLVGQLVVLSCCWTARGEPTTEGVLGIARAFLGAGARSVLVALWALPDVETKVFMEHFYDEICEGSSSCEALKKVMNMFQQSDNEDHRSFHTWAPFTIIGEDVRFTKKEIEEVRRCSENTGD